MVDGFLTGSPARDAIARLYSVAVMQNQDLQKKWIGLSHKLGSKLAPGSAVTIQSIGSLDLILRALEEEFQNAAPDENYILTLQTGLSASWIGSAYEIFRIAKNKLPDDAKVRKIHDQLRLLRVPLEKYEISGDRELREPLKLVKTGDDGEDVYLYDKTDPNRQHIMPIEVSARGSVQWLAIDLENTKHSWIERLRLSEEIIDYGDNLNST